MKGEGEITRANGDKVINGIPRCTLTPHVRARFISFLFSPGGWSHLLVTIPYDSKFKFAHGISRAMMHRIRIPHSPFERGILPLLHTFPPFILDKHFSRGESAVKRLAERRTSPLHATGLVTRAS